MVVLEEFQSIHAFAKIEKTYVLKATYDDNT